ncbi:hypothetical protein [Streptococcus acidominimus]|uniref:Uncharacterized protein n=1 Tax=Streptococcus acidominimus TaxID=1326 RepID=A0A1Q8E715_STRAI|nr:hypothetical protein [Streptococcus acidominimus]OLF47588.1 hypothetical protein BU200_10115 [Streptococcus acidominimus]SUN41418.1 Uncharacterised protein [Streptococcus acidominimus]
MNELFSYIEKIVGSFECENDLLVLDEEYIIISNNHLFLSQIVLNILGSIGCEFNYSIGYSDLVSHDIFEIQIHVPSKEKDKLKKYFENI